MAKKRSQRMVTLNTADLQGLLANSTAKLQQLFVSTSLLFCTAFLTVVLCGRPGNPPPRRGKDGQD